MRNKYPLPKIGDLFDRIRETQIFFEDRLEDWLPSSKNKGLMYWKKKTKKLLEPNMDTTNL